ncbi:hypothetical protein CMMCAS05_08235 [Clavibacter michiganensis subsp. michiganensis]|nr:hypothetical protein CMMCAS05_08235 [Clavibacter michiganensis subsp. michiganensis]
MLVAVPICAAGTAFCTTSTTTCMIRPRPSPKMKRNTQISHTGVWAVSEVISTSASIVSSVPTMGKIRYLPVRLMRMPDVIDMPMRPTIIGRSRSPETAAEVPVDICRNVGTKPMAANIPMPSARPMAVAFTKTGFRKRLSGITGSSARDSVNTNSDAATTSPRPHAQVASDPQP